MNMWNELNQKLYNVPTQTTKRPFSFSKPIVWLFDFYYISESLCVDVRAFVVLPATLSAYCKPVNLAALVNQQQINSLPRVGEQS